MGILDRKYMRRPFNGSWLSHRSTPELIVICFSVVSLLSSVVWLARDMVRLGKATGATKQSLVVNINNATLAELQTLPGIGEARARLIVAHRPYESVDALVELKGVGSSLVQDLRPFLKTEGKTERLRSTKQE